MTAVKLAKNNAILMQRFWGDTNMITKTKQIIEDTDDPIEIVEDLSMLTIKRSEDYEQFVDTGFENAQVTALMKAVGTNRIAQIAGETEQFYKDYYKDKDAVEITGLTVFIKDLAQIVVSQARSLIFALFASRFPGFVDLSIMANRYPGNYPARNYNYIQFWIDGIYGIDLSIPTAMISCIDIRWR